MRHLVLITILASVATSAGAQTYLHPETLQECVTQVGPTVRSSSGTANYVNFVNICAQSFLVRRVNAKAEPIRGEYLWAGNPDAPFRRSIICTDVEQCTQWILVLYGENKGAIERTPAERGGVAQGVLEGKPILNSGDADPTAPKPDECGVTRQGQLVTMPLRNSGDPDPCAPKPDKCGVIRQDRMVTMPLRNSGDPDPCPENTSLHTIIIPASDTSDEPALKRRPTDSSLRGLMQQQIERADRAEPGRAIRERADLDAARRQEQARLAAEQLAAQRQREESQRLQAEQTRKDREELRDALRGLSDTVNAIAAGRASSGGVGSPSSSGSVDPRAVGGAASGEGLMSNSQCESEIFKVHQEASRQSDNAGNERMARSQRALFSGPCRSHPSAPAYLATADRIIAENQGGGSSKKQLLHITGQPCVTQTESKRTASGAHVDVYFRNICDVTLSVRIQPANDSTVRGTGIGPRDRTYITCKASDGCERGKWWYQ